MFGLFKKKCEICASNNVGPFIVYKLAKSNKIAYSTTNPHAGLKMADDLGGFDFAFTDTNPNKPNGNMYLYKTASDLGQHSFCSLKCAYDYSKKTNTIVLYQDPENLKLLRGITPDIIEINSALGNPEYAKYRGQPAGNIG
ncbi:MAG: hypothetical protein HJHJAOHD_02646 [Flavobacteriales bacterium]|nr:hypothetical protein [Flavobacteriales bacterium]